MANRVFDFFKLKNTSIINAQTYYIGSGAITGTVTDTMAIGRKVRLYDQITGLLLSETKCDSNGSYSFVGLNTEIQYEIVVIDYPTFTRNSLTASGRLAS